MSGITINPALTQNALGSFNVESVGFIQGQALDQPAIRNSLAGGILGPNETLPMWGGVGISEALSSGIGTGTIPETGSSGTLGGTITRATNVTANTAASLTGFSVFDQNYSAVNSPESPVPLSAPSMQVNFYRLGSGARIAVAMAPGLVDLRGNIITQKVSWDFVNQQLVPYVARLRGRHHHRCDLGQHGWRADDVHLHGHRPVGRRERGRRHQRRGRRFDGGGGGLQRPVRRRSRATSDQHRRRSARVG